MEVGERARLLRLKTFKTAIVVIPPKDVWPPIQAIRRRYDRQVRRWMPHINLIYPFRPRQAFPFLAPRLLEACRSIAPFPVTLVRFRAFHHGRERYTLWLEPEPKAPLIRLHRALLRVVPDCDDLDRFPGGFTPHLSVGQARGKARLEGLLRDLQGAWEPLTFVVEAISLIFRHDPPEDRFRVDRTLPLGV